jgi:hypothetical protein
VLYNYYAETMEFYDLIGQDPKRTKDYAYPRGRENPEEAAEPTDDELGRIRSELDDQSARRNRPLIARLRVLVDGAECASLSLDRNSEVSFAVEEGSQLIEVRTACEEGDLLLAVHVLTYDDAAPDSPPRHFSTKFDCGRKISFTISPLRQLFEEDGTPVFGVWAVVSYEKARRLSALERAWRRLGLRLPRARRPR